MGPASVMLAILNYWHIFPIPEAECGVSVCHSEHVLNALYLLRSLFKATRINLNSFLKFNLMLASGCFVCGCAIKSVLFIGRPGSVPRQRLWDFPYTRMVLWQFFSVGTSIFPCQYNSANPPYPIYNRTYN